MLKPPPGWAKNFKIYMLYLIFFHRCEHINFQILYLDHLFVSTQKTVRHINVNLWLGQHFSDSCIYTKEIGRSYIQLDCFFRCIVSYFNLYNIIQWHTFFGSPSTHFNLLGNKTSTFHSQLRFSISKCEE